MSWVRTSCFQNYSLIHLLQLLLVPVLVKGIVEVSGRTTSVDMPYWYVASRATLFEYYDRIYQT